MKEKLRSVFTVDNIMIYLLSSIIPVIFLMLLGVYYQLNSITPYANTLCFPEILFNGLAGSAMYFYLSHTHRMTISSTYARFLFSITYVLSSYALVQEHAIPYLTVYALLPLLMLSFERLLSEGKSIGFVLILSITLMVEAVTGCTIAIYFTILFLFESSKDSLGTFMGNIIHFLFTLLFAILISGFLSVPKLYEYFTVLSGSDYIGFSSSYPVPTYLSRFLLGAVSHETFNSAYGLNMYIGLFIALGVILHFFNSEISLKKKVSELCCLIIILFSVEFSPLRYIIELLTPTILNTIYYCFFPSFYLLVLGIKGLSEVSKLSMRQKLASSALLITFITLCFCGTAHNFTFISILSNYLFVILYTVLILLSGHKSSHSYGIIKKLAISFCILELFINTFTITNKSNVPISADASVHYVWENNSIPADYASLQEYTIPYENEYLSFQADHTPGRLQLLINALYYNVELQDDELTAINPYHLSTMDEEVNFLCQKIGMSSPLFEKNDNISLSFSNSASYTVTDQGHNIYNLFSHKKYRELTPTIIPFTVTYKSTKPIILINSITDEWYTFPSSSEVISETGYFLMDLAGQSRNFHINILTVDNEVLDSLSAYILAYKDLHPTNTDFNMTPYYIGIIFTMIGVLFLLSLIFNKDKEKVIGCLLFIKYKITNCGIWQRISDHYTNNYVYHLAFGIPLCLYLFILIVFSCEPFGVYSILDQDGLCSILPAYLDYYNNIKEGIFHLTMNEGFSTSMFPFNVFYLPLLLVKDVSIAMVLAVGLMMAISSWSVVYYMTHRLWMPKVNKSDYKLLIPAFLYSLNTFMLAMHGYVDWYSTYMFLPLIFLGLDYLIYKKKWFLYTMALAFCMYNNIQLALYICIALFIVFFLYRFENIKDFISKGLRFAACSILSALIAFTNVAGTLLYALGGTAYQTADSIAPSFHLFGSFWEQWKNLMIFSPSKAVSSFDSDISIYMGVLSLILILSYFVSRQFTRKDKIRRFALIAILLFSFNEQVTAYVINGFHYQSNVPNRHVFLFMFLCSIIVYDGIVAIEKFSIRQILLVCTVPLAFTIVCQYLSAGNTTLAMYSSIAILVLYGLFLVICKRKHNYQFIAKCLAGAFLLELAANMWYTTSNYQLNAILTLGNYKAQNTYNNSTLGFDSSLYRGVKPATQFLCFGSYTNTNGVTRFSPQLSESQKSLAKLYGYYIGLNYTLPNYNSTPFGTSLSATKYIFITERDSFGIADLTFYKYLGYKNGVFIYENPWVLPLGFYAPTEVAQLYFNNYDVMGYANDFVNLYCEDVLPLYKMGLFNEDSLTQKDSIVYTDINGQVLSVDGMSTLFNNALNDPGTYFPIRDIRMNLSVTPVTDGYIYLYNEEFIPIGMGYKDNALEASLAYHAPSNPYEFIWASFNLDTFKSFHNEVMKNTMGNIMVDDNRITGTTNYEKAGYTMLSFPYDTNWKAYIDGTEVPVISPENTFLLVETPAGQHTIELVYTTPKATKICIIISLTSLVISLLLFIIIKKQNSFVIN